MPTGRVIGASHDGAPVSVPWTQQRTAFASGAARSDPAWRPCRPRRTSSRCSARSTRFAASERVRILLLLLLGQCTAPIVVDVDGGVREDAGGNQTAPDGGVCDPPCGTPDAGPDDAGPIVTGPGCCGTACVDPEGSGSGPRTTTPVLLSDADRDPAIVLRDDHLAAAFYELGAVRSTRSIAPGSGAYYFEARTMADQSGFYGAGVAIASAPLTGARIGADDRSFGLSSSGDLHFSGARVRQTAPVRTAGFAVDYRGATPRVYVVTAAGVVHVQQLPFTEPVFIYLAGERRSATYEIEINPGNDTTNHPFELDPVRALAEADASDVARALTLGFGATFAGAPDMPPHLAVSADATVELGAEVTVEACAVDVEDGVVSSAIRWELLSGPHFDGRVLGEGERFTFRAGAVGVHPARAEIIDAVGHRVERVVRIRVAGPVRMIDEPRLEPDALAGEGAVLREDGLAARWIGAGKYGIRANQPLYGEFWYFEFERLVDPWNQGGGVVIGGGNLSPYSWHDTPPSMSVNTLGAIFRDLLWQHDFPLPEESYTHYGFAVDYRAEHPTVYVILGGEVVFEAVLDDVWVELYPMIYGNPTGIEGYDSAIHLAAPFAYDPRAALTRYGVDASALVVGWGVTPTSN
jgi:hypothetical protein